MNPKTRWELIDQDYINKLSEEEKQWLSNFNEEYISGNFNHKGKRLHRKKKERLECYGRNNSRNRDMFTLLRTVGWMSGESSVDLASAAETKQRDNPGAVENAVIDLIDLKNALKES